MRATGTTECLLRLPGRALQWRARPAALCRAVPRYIFHVTHVTRHSELVERLVEPDREHRLSGPRRRNPADREIERPQFPM